MPDMIPDLNNPFLKQTYFRLEEKYNSFLAVLDQYKNPGNSTTDIAKQILGIAIEANQILVQVEKTIQRSTSNLDPMKRLGTTLQAVSFGYRLFTQIKELADVFAYLIIIALEDLSMTSLVNNDSESVKPDNIGNQLPEFITQMIAALKESPDILRTYPVGLWAECWNGLRMASAMLEKSHGRIRESLMPKIEDVTTDSLNYREN